MHLSPAALSIAGLIVNLAGVVLLFRFGIPYYVRTGGEQYIILRQLDLDARAKEDRATKIGWLGLGLVVLGTFFQVAGSYLAG